MMKKETAEAYTAVKCCVFSCVYMPALLFNEYYTGKLQEGSKYTNMTFICLLVIFELAKIIYIFISHKGNGETLSAKTLIAKRTLRAVFHSKTMDALKLLIAVVVFVSMHIGGIVLFGTADLAQSDGTISLVLILVILTVFPLYAYCEVDIAVRAFYGEVYNGECALEMLVRNVIFTIFGSWGGVAILHMYCTQHLMVWPLPCIIGAFVGYHTAGLMTSVRMLLLIFSWKMALKCEDEKPASITASPVPAPAVTKNISAEPTDEIDKSNYIDPENMLTICVL